MTVGISPIRCDYCPPSNLAVVQKALNLRRALEREVFDQHFNLAFPCETDDFH
jgi:hypothetical protein